MYITGVTLLLSTIYLIGALVVADILRKNLINYKCEYIWYTSGVTVRIFGFYNYSLRLTFCEYLILSLVVGENYLVTLVVKYTSPHTS